MEVMMLAGLRQLEYMQGFVCLMYEFLEMMLGKFIKFFMLPSGNAVYGNSQRLSPVLAPDHLMWMRAYQGRWTSWDLYHRGHTLHLNPARHLSPWSIL
jgi:hypothetical protein